MNTIDQIRAETLSAPNCTLWLNDPVIFRRHPGAHEEYGRVVGRTVGADVYDIETTGERVQNMTIVRLDEGASHMQRVAEGVAP